MKTHQNEQPSDLHHILYSGTNEDLGGFLRLLQRPELVELFRELDDPKLRSKISCLLHPRDLAELLPHLPSPQWSEILINLDENNLSSLLTVLEDPNVLKELRRLHHNRLPSLIADMESDDAADILGDLPQNQAAAILEKMPQEESEPIKTLLQYPEDSAGGLMQKELVQIPLDLNVSQAIENLRNRSKKLENIDIYEVFVIDKKGSLQGKISLSRLILSHPEAPILDLLESELFWVHPTLDQEEVADYFQRYDLVSLPVVDEKKMLIGRITIDDVIDVIQEEASEDILHLGGANGEDLVYDRIIRSTFLRLPWLFTNLVGGLFTGYLMWIFQATLSEIIALITFIPVITGMGGNVGTQSSSITVRGFAINRIDLSNFGRYLFKEMRVGALMGSICGVCLSIIGWVWHGQPFLGLVVGISLFMAMTLAAITGSMFPALFEKLNIDPALASGPFVTTINDVTGILIYLRMATLFREWLIV